MKAFLPAIAWALVILFLSTMPNVSLPESIWDLLAWDKLAHAGVYGLLTLLLISGFQKQGNNFSVFFAVLISSTYGIVLEIVQYSFFPNRYFELLDIIANIIGSIGSLLFVKYLLK